MRAQLFRRGLKGCESVFRPWPLEERRSAEAAVKAGETVPFAIEKRITARHRESLRGSQCRSHVTILFELCRDGPFLLASLGHYTSPTVHPRSLSRPMSTSYARFRPPIGHARSMWCKRGDRAREERAEIVVQVPSRVARYTGPR